MGVVSRFETAEVEDSRGSCSKGKGEDADKEQCGFPVPGAQEKDREQGREAALQSEIGAPTEKGSGGEVVREAEGDGQDEVEEAEDDEEGEGEFGEGRVRGGEAVDFDRGEAGEQEADGGGELHDEELGGVEDGAVRCEVPERGGVAGGEHGPAEEIAALERHAFGALGVAGEVDIGGTGSAVEIGEPEAGDAEHGAGVQGGKSTGAGRFGRLG